jgi:hypothetical protein
MRLLYNFESWEERLQCFDLEANLWPERSNETVRTKEEGDAEEIGRQMQAKEMATSNLSTYGCAYRRPTNK